MAHILILDDVLDAAIMVKRILAKKGHEIVTFTEEEEALRHVRDHRVDLAILDIKLKKMSGIEVLEELKRTDPAIKAIVLTGYPSIETARQALRVGAGEYCLKPIDKEELEEKVNRMLAT